MENKLKQLLSLFKKNRSLKFGLGVGILLTIGAIGFLTYKTGFTVVKPEKSSTTNEPDVNPLCEWDYLDLPSKQSVEDPKIWGGWHLDKSVTPSACKAITFSNDFDPGIPFKSKEECEHACSVETKKTFEEKYPLKKVAIAESAGRDLYLSTDNFTYHDLPYRFSIDLPKNIYLEIGNGREVDTRISNINRYEGLEEDYKEKVVRKNWFVLNIGNLYPGYSHPGVSTANLEEFVETYLDSSLGKTEILKSSDATLDGIKAKKATYRLFGFDYTGEEATSIFIHRDRFYWFSCNYDDNNNLKQCESLISTIKLTD